MPERVAAWLSNRMRICQAQGSYDRAIVEVSGYSSSSASL